MNVEREDHDGAVLFVVEGQVDMHTSPALRRQLRKALKARATPIALDLSRVTFIDSSGLATLIEALQGMRSYEGALRLFGLTPAVQRLLELSKLTSIFDVSHTREEALRA